MRLRLTVIAAALVAVFGAASLSGHGLEIEVRMTPPAVVVRAAYADAESAAYAAVKIYGPGETRAEYQIGNADASGRFAFIPDRAGDWRLVVDDELGHRRERTIPVDEDFLKAAARMSEDPAAPPAGGGRIPSGSQPPLAVRALVGVALILGAAGVLYGFKARRRAGK